MSLGDVGIATSRWNARNKSIALMALYPMIVAYTAYWQIYFLYILFNHKELAHHVNPDITERVNSIYIFIFPFITLGLLWWFFKCLGNQDDIIRKLFRAHFIERKDNSDLFSMVETLAIQLGRPIPEIYVIETFARNSFASTLADGTDRIYITTGLIDNLSKDEVEAVLAHEFSHIVSGDTRWIGLSIIFTNLLGTLPVAMVDQVNTLGQDYKRQDLFHLFFIYFIVLFPLWVGYFSISLVRLFIMFEREHQADLLAVEITKNPDALMRALFRIRKHARIPHIPSDVMFLCIDNPRGGFFATHPRLFSRLRKIASMSNTPIPTITEASSASVHKRFGKNKLLERTFRPFKHGR
ncbi:MAG: M48 family metalloprotease [Pseudobdellovibrionaceae bacterium]|jgi:heat shock protein HtpX|nr:M48 family metalloprotease [Pseudobdellovibrionaceae bacterium]